VDSHFVNAIEAIYAAAPQPSLWPTALQMVADCLDDVGALLIWQRDDGAFGTIVSPSLAAAQRDYENNGWLHQDIRALRAVKHSYWANGDTATDRDVCTDEEIRTHPYYTTFLARHGLRWCGTVGVAPDPHISAALSVQRAIIRPEYSDLELETIGKFGRHVEKSLRLSIRLLDAELIKVGLGNALARIGMGVFTLDSLGRVVFANPAGEHLMGDGITVLNDRLYVGDSTEGAALESAIKGIISSAPSDIGYDSRPILVRRQKVDRPLAVYVLPVAASGKLTEEFLTQARAIVLIIDPQTDEPADPTLVRDVLGLTLAEARVAALIGAGLPPREAAKRLGIAEETARTALKRVFSKVGVSRQSELAALLAKLVLR
jgi:DNA-binding CsgD family transcriptional regulator/PAS domain-containing protein